MTRPGSSRRKSPNVGERTETAPALRSSLADICYDGLKSLIITCEIPPGSRFTEKELINRTGFGRTPVREALARLDFEGLVETLPRSGYRVTEVTLKSVNDLFDVWKLVGPLIARRASEKLDDKLWVELRAISRPACEPATVAIAIETSNRIFELFAKATDNRDLIFLSNRLRAEMLRIYTLYLGSQHGRDWLLEQNRLWDDLSWFRDPDVAAARITLGIAASHAGIVQLLATDTD
jgi:DNA-binding GntR family transcriptional regulator